MYKIPDKEKVKDAILKVMDKHREVNSQETFLKLVLEELKKTDEDFVVSSDRVKKITSKIKSIRVHVDKRRSRREAIKCFVCGGELLHMKTKDLQGKETLVGKRCKACGFELDRDKLSPRRYIFYKH